MYSDRMFVIKWFDMKTFVMLSIIDFGNITNYISEKHQKKVQTKKENVTVTAMAQWYNQFIKGTNLHDQKTALVS